MPKYKGSRVFDKKAIYHIVKIFYENRKILRENEKNFKLYSSCYLKYVSYMK